MNQPRLKPLVQQAPKSIRSRYLDVLSGKEKERRKRKLGAISFRKLGDGGNV